MPQCRASDRETSLTVFQAFTLNVKISSCDTPRGVTMVPFLKRYMCMLCDLQCFVLIFHIKISISHFAYSLSLPCVATCIIPEKCSFASLVQFYTTNVPQDVGKMCNQCISVTPASDGILKDFLCYFCN